MGESDLRSSVIRGIFLYMLQYLSVVEKDRGQIWRSSNGGEFQIGRYPRLSDRGCRLRAFETLRRWGSKKYFDLEEYVSFSGMALVQAYTTNLAG